MEDASADRDASGRPVQSRCDAGRVPSDLNQSSKHIFKKNKKERRQSNGPFLFFYLYSFCLTMRTASWPFGFLCFSFLSSADFFVPDSWLSRRPPPGLCTFSNTNVKPVTLLMIWLSGSVMFTCTDFCDSFWFFLFSVFFPFIFLPLHPSFPSWVPLTPSSLWREMGLRLNTIIDISHVSISTWGGPKVPKKI